jgi:hypothetical protein
MVWFFSFFFAYLHHDPALPKYENHDNEAKKHVGGLERLSPGRARDGGQPLPRACPAI